MLCCRWDPDRFAATGPHGKRGNEFCPFGIHSRRKCPGYLFSYFEVAVFVAILLQRLARALSVHVCACVCTCMCVCVHACMCSLHSH